MMRRALGWMAVGLLLAGAAAAIVMHLRPPAGAAVVLPAPAASLRAGETMPLEWPGGSINPNTASVQELEAFDGIGPVLAQRIVEEREQNGPFVLPQDLIVIRGIGEKTLMKLWPQMALPPPQTTKEQE